MVILPDGNSVDPEKVEAIKAQGVSVSDIYLSSGSIVKVHCSVSSIIDVMIKAMSKYGLSKSE